MLSLYVGWSLNLLNRWLRRTDHLLTPNSTSETHIKIKIIILTRRVIIMFWRVVLRNDLFLRAVKYTIVITALIQWNKLLIGVSLLLLYLLLRPLLDKLHYYRLLLGNIYHRIYRLFLGKTFNASRHHRLLLLRHYLSCFLIGKLYFPYQHIYFLFVIVSNVIIIIIFLVKGGVLRANSSIV